MYALLLGVWVITVLQTLMQVLQRNSLRLLVRRMWMLWRSEGPDAVKAGLLQGVAECLHCLEVV